MSVSEIERGGFKEEVLLCLINEAILTSSLLELFRGKVDAGAIFSKLFLFSVFREIDV